MLDTLLSYIAHPALWVAAVAIGTCGEIAKKLILGNPNNMPKGGYSGWRGVYYVTYKAHAMFVGALIGLIPGLPVSDAFENNGIAGGVIFYLGAGVLAMVAYAAIVGSIKNAVKNVGATLGK